jgi:hypothetical protein
MAAGITPRLAGVILEPVETVAEWAKENYIRQESSLPPIDYIEFKESPRITEGK